MRTIEHVNVGERVTFVVQLENFTADEFRLLRGIADAKDGRFRAVPTHGFEATVKTFKRTSAKLWLLPQNSAYDPIDGDSAVILGRVVTVLRKI